MRKLIILPLVLTVFGCSYLELGSRSETDLNSYPDSYLKSDSDSNLDPKTKELNRHDQFCKKLKRDIIFNTSSFSAGEASPTQKVEMERIYEKHGCKRLEK